MLRGAALCLSAILSAQEMMERPIRQRAFVEPQRKKRNPNKAAQKQQRLARKARRKANG